MDYNLFLILLVFSLIATLVSYFTKSKLFTVMAGVGFLLCGLFWWYGIEQVIGKNVVYSYATLNETNYNSTGDISGYVAKQVINSSNTTDLFQTFNSNSTVTGAGGGVIANPNQYNWAFGLMLALLGCGIIFATAATWRGSGD